MGVFFEKRRTSWPVIIGLYVLFFAAYGVAILGLLWLMTHESLLMTVIFLSIGVLGLSTYFIITLGYEASTKKRIVAAVCSYLFISTSTAAIAISAIIVNENWEFLAVPSTIINAYLIAGFITYVIAVFLRRLKNIRKNMFSSLVFWIGSVIIPFFPTSVVALMALILGSVNYFPQLMAIVFGLLLAINMLVFYLQDTLAAAYEDKLKSTLHAQEKEFYFAQAQLMQKSVKKVRSVRHDMNFHLATLKDIAADNQAATDYINNLLGDIGESEVYSNTGNIAFDSIINFKLKTAKDDHIKVDLSLLIPPVLNIEIADIVTILGNLLDNALDAVAKVEDKTIRLDIAFSKGNLHIKLDNAFDGDVKYIDGRMVSLKAGDEHGYGLQNIRKSVEKYDGHMDMSHVGNVFSVDILLYVGG